MPRPITLGNGTMAVGIDSRGVLRDLFAPFVGYPNHTIDGGIRCGLRVGERFDWLDGAHGHPVQRMANGALVGLETYRLFDREVQVEHAVDPELSVYERAIVVGGAGVLFFNQYLRVGQSGVGNTAFWHPGLQAAVHYRGHHWLAFVARSGQNAPDQKSFGFRDFAGHAGTWVEAESGRLSGKSIEQGCVDSTFALTLDESGAATYAILWAPDLDSLERLAAEYQPGCISRRRESDARWLAGLDLQAPSRPALAQGLLMARAHCGENGSVAASLDSDILATNRATYAYCWPRDAAHIADLFIRVGEYELPAKALKFCEARTSDARPFLLQKYRPDGALGATWHPWEIEGEPWVPHQLDQTASILATSAKFHAATGESACPDFDRRALAWLREQVDEDGGIAPSFNLWEERFGQHVYSVCAAADALRRWNCEEEATRIGAWIERELWTGEFYGRAPGDPVADASSLWTALFDLRLDEGRVRANSEAIGRLLGSGGGVARYLGDGYFRDGEQSNPWLITTLWLGRALSGDALEQAIDWCLERALPTGALPEQAHPETDAPISVAPLAWSHAELCHALLDLDAPQPSRFPDTE